jgi:hypothetical protein
LHKVLQHGQVRLGNAARTVPAHQLSVVASAARGFHVLRQVVEQHELVRAEVLGQPVHGVPLEAGALRRRLLVAVRVVHKGRAARHRQPQPVQLAIQPRMRPRRVDGQVEAVLLAAPDGALGIPARERVVQVKDADRHICLHADKKRARACV